MTNIYAEYSIDQYVIYLFTYFFVRWPFECPCVDTMFLCS